MLLLLRGKAADRYGCKRVLLFGLGLFGLASLLGGFARNPAISSPPGPPRASGPQTPELAHGRDAEAVREYEEAFTTVLMQAGTPKMMARVLASLYTSDAGSLTAAELVQRLQVSPASISKAIAFLESQGLVRRERDERRRERYIADEDVWYQSMIASARGTIQVAEIARQGVGVLGPHTPAATRLENIARFLDFVSEGITRAADQAREVLHTKPETTSDGAAEPRSDRG